MTYAAKANIMLNKYSSDERKLRVKRTLEILRPRSLMEAISITEVPTGLTKLVYKIKELSPQFTSAFCDDFRKIDYLKKAVLA